MLLGMTNTNNGRRREPWPVPQRRRRQQPRKTRGPREQLPVRITHRDLELLRFIGAHRFVLAEHVHYLLGRDRSITYRLLARLARKGLIRYERVFHHQPGVFMITSRGLAVCEMRLPKPRIDLRIYRHEQHVPTVWLAATAGYLGDPARVFTERELRHHNQTGALTSEVLVAGPLAARLGGVDRAGNPRLHHPDVLIIHPDGLLTALELELTLKSRTRLREIVLGYGLDGRFHKTVYFTNQNHVAGALLQLSSEFGTGGKVIVKHIDELSTRAILNAAVGSGF